MPSFRSSVRQRVYVSPQTAIATVPNSGGAWTNTSNKLVPHASLNMQRMVDRIAAEFKTGQASSLAGIPGRVSSSFSLDFPFMPSGAAGTSPNCDLILKSVFGVAATTVSSTSVTYNLADSTNIFPFCLAGWNDLANGDQFSFGNVVESLSMNIGGSGYFRMTADGKGYNCLDYPNFANEDTAGLGGLTGYPAEPSSPTLAGNIIPAFVGSAVTVGGSSLDEFVSASIRIQTGRTLLMDGGKYPTGITHGRRVVTLESLKVHDSNGSVLDGLKNLAASKAATDVVIVLGTAAGYIVTVTLKGVQFGNYRAVDAGGGVDIEFETSPAHANAIANTNEIKIALT